VLHQPSGSFPVEPARSSAPDDTLAVASVTFAAASWLLAGYSALHPDDMLEVQPEDALELQPLLETTDFFSVRLSATTGGGISGVRRESSTGPPPA
jgi:hypothetical protein